MPSFSLFARATPTNPFSLLFLDLGPSRFGGEHVGTQLGQRDCIPHLAGNSIHSLLFENLTPATILFAETLAKLTF